MIPVPSRPPTVCPRTGCSERQPCPEHYKARAKAYDRQRADTYARKVYKSTRWQKLRKIVLSRDPACILCEIKEATDVDHIQPISEAPELAYDLGNLRGLCRGCHNKVTHGGGDE